MREDPCLRPGATTTSAPSPMPSTSSVNVGRCCVVRELILGPQRFSELRKALANTSANVVTDRLRGSRAAV